MTLTQGLIIIFIILINIFIIQCKQTRITKSKLNRQIYRVENETISSNQWNTTSILGDNNNNLTSLSYHNINTSKSLNNTNLIDKHHNKRLNLQYLFKNFEFKGFGISLVKSIIKWQSIGIGIRIPVTANFPNYDSLVYLPKITSLIGCGYPYQVRWTVAISVPIQTFLYAIAYCLNKSNITSYVFNINVRSPKYDESVQRIGITLNLRYNRDYGLQATVGSWVNYCPSKQTVEFVKPVLFASPAMMISLVNYIYATSHNKIFMMMTRSEHNESVSQNITTISDNNNTRVINTSTSTISHMTITYDNILNETCSNDYSVNHIDSLRSIEESDEDQWAPVLFSDRRHSNDRKRNIYVLKEPKDFWYWHNKVTKWTSSKSIVLATSLGLFRTRNDVFMGSSVTFDIMPYFPFIDIQNYLKSKINYLKSLIFPQKMTPKVSRVRRRVEIDVNKL